MCISGILQLVKVALFYCTCATVITVSFTCVQVCSVLDDVTAAGSNTSPEHCLARSYDAVLDKGTYDAICMNPIDTQQQRRKYREAVSRLVCIGGLFIITSCNWTQAELLQQFDTGNNLAVFYDSFGATILQKFCYRIEMLNFSSASALQLLCSFR